MSRHQRRLRGSAHAASAGGTTVILTVTLNAAIDRTIAVPNFRQGHRHRAVEASTAAGGKGVNVARALKLLGRPVIATGPRRRPDRRPADGAARRGVDPYRLHLDRGGDADQPRRDRPDLGRADRDQRARPGGHRRGARALHARSLLYLARGADICVLAGSLPPGGPRRLLRAHRSRPEARSEWRRSSTPRASRCAPACAPGPPRHPERCARPRSWSATSSATARTCALGLAELIDLGAEEAVITRPDGCVASLADDERRISTSRSPPRSSSRSRRSAPATLSSPATSRPATRARPRGLPRLGVACGAESTQHFGAGVVDPGEVERIRSRVEVAELEARPRSR